MVEFAPQHQVTMSIMLNHRADLLIIIQLAYNLKIGLKILVQEYETHIKTITIILHSHFHHEATAQETALHVLHLLLQEVVADHEATKLLNA